MGNLFSFVGWATSLSEVFALEFCRSTMDGTISKSLSGESLTLKKMTAIALGLLGVVIIVQPTQGVMSVGRLSCCTAFYCAIPHTPRLIVSQY
ncbi:hypothetical protein O9993_08220 [Vibrio lentus]|nr:hypothetical protein [Vibrio lentus]